VHVALVRQAGRAAGRLQVAVPGGVAVADQLQQVGADGVEPVADRDPLVGLEVLEQVESGGTEVPAIALEVRRRQAPRW
jgi:hypothetical protein